MRIRATNLNNPDPFVYQMAGFGYRFLRWCILLWNEIRSLITGHQIDYETVVAQGDQILSRVRISAPEFLRNCSIPAGISHTIHGLTFPSPVTVAAFKSNQDVLKLWLELGAGAIILKTIMPETRPGNPRPRLMPIRIDGKSGYINALGLPGPGIHKLLATLDFSLFRFQRPVGISIGGTRPEDYLNSARIVRTFFNGKPESEQLFLELNISCPNTPEGQNLSKNPALLKKVLSGIREVGDFVLSVKIPPDLPPETLAGIGETVAMFPRMILNAGNTRKIAVRSLGLSREQFMPDVGGLSGAPLRERTLELIALLATYEVPLIATGGIESPADVRVALEAGASLVGMATGLIKNMYRIPEINAKLSS